MRLYAVLADGIALSPEEMAWEMARPWLPAAAVLIAAAVVVVAVIMRKRRK